MCPGYEYLLGIDIGNTNTKCVALSTSGHVLAVERMESAVAFTVDKRELDGERLWQLVLKILQKTVAKVRMAYPLAEALAVSVAAMGCRAILLNERKEQVFFPIRNDGGNEMHRESVCLHTGYQSNYDNLRLQMMRAYEGQEERMAEIAYILPISDYIIYRLCGIMSISYNSAGSLSMLDIQKKNWWREFLPSRYLAESIFLPLVESGKAIEKMDSRARRAIGISGDVTVVSGGQDYLCAVLAGGMELENHILEVIGSYEMLSCISKRSGIPGSYAGVTEFWDLHIYPGLFSHTLECQGALWLEWLRNDVLSTAYYRIDDREWELMIEGLNDLILSPILPLESLFLPETDDIEYLRSYAASYICSLKGVTGRSAQLLLMSSVIQGLNLKVRMVLEECLKDGISQSVLTVLGGGARSHYWMANKADILGIPIQVPNIPEASAAGAAMLAGIGAGCFENFKEASGILQGRSVSVYQPDPERIRQWDEIYQMKFLPSYKR